VDIWNLAISFRKSASKVSQVYNTRDDTTKRGDDGSPKKTRNS
jgi:hypothetical protein